MSDLAEYTRPTVVEVVAPHCVECRAMQPDMEAVAENHTDSVDLIVLDATRETEQVASLHVLGTPTLIAVRNGVEVARFTGRRSRSELEQFFAAVAAGQTDSIRSSSRGDRTVWMVGGGLLAAAGLVSGPSWILVGLGTALTGYAALRVAAG